MVKRGSINYSFNKMHDEEIAKTAKGLSHIERIRIIKELYKGPKSLTELADNLKMDNSVCLFHLKHLLESDLIYSEYLPNKKGKKQIFTIKFDVINLDFSSDTTGEEDVYREEMPIGMYSDATFYSFFRICDNEKAIKLEAEDAFNPIRQNAQLLWSYGGSITYKFSNKFLANKKKIESINISLEICSETNFYRNDYKSDISFKVNNIYIGTYTCPGDFGGKRGLLTPSWWPINNTQYGILVNIDVRKNGSYINEIKVSDVTIDDLHIENNINTSFTLYNDKNAIHYGGFNLFGKGFGNCPQDIIFTVNFKK